MDLSNIATNGVSLASPPLVHDFLSPTSPWTEEEHDIWYKQSQEKMKEEEDRRAKAYTKRTLLEFIEARKELLLEMEMDDEYIGWACGDYAKIDIALAIEESEREMDKYDHDLQQRIENNRLIRQNQRKQQQNNNRK